MGRDFFEIVADLRKSIAGLPSSACWLMTSLLRLPFLPALTLQTSCRPPAPLSVLFKILFSTSYGPMTFALICVVFSSSLTPGGFFRTRIHQYPFFFPSILVPSSSLGGLYISFIFIVDNEVCAFRHHELGNGHPGPPCPPPANRPHSEDKITIFPNTRCKTEQSLFIFQRHCNTTLERPLRPNSTGDFIFGADFFFPSIETNPPRKYILPSSLGNIHSLFCNKRSVNHSTRESIYLFIDKKPVKFFVLNISGCFVVFL